MFFDIKDILKDNSTETIRNYKTKLETSKPRLSISNNWETLSGHNAASPS